ncbi:hypothetical protein LHJ74_28585 [Streptomyces sp. N2-109]|uniref:Uncharacterized protein n=1 Tax=Streptomyces gossypii TaxID=2883101 RepID=A0ABT2K0X1_9ACTN|nr:hypothetical protein [Streptomyces gossypii]MCT2593817.1 hypothetical protein [Streptomyces gossypii]
MPGDERPALPPVRLPADADLARDALAAPLFARAVRLARWAGPGIRVGAGGELLGGQLKEATVHLDLDDGGEGPAEVSEAWNLAVDTGLVEIEEDEGAEPSLESDEPVATATVGEELDRLTGGGSPQDVLDIWQSGLESVLADAATPSLEDLLDGLDPAVSEDGRLDPDSIDLDALDWNPEDESEFLDGVLGNLYLLSVTDPAVTEGAMVPLPVLAASLIVPEDMEEPTDEVLEEVSAAMMRLDDQFRILEPTGLIAYQPVDEALTQESEGDLPDEPDDEDVSRYGMVRLTPLGMYGVRERMRDAGVDAPVIGDLAGESAETLLGAVPSFPEDSARLEIEQWLADRVRLDAARELLAAGQGSDKDAPARRLACQLALSLTGSQGEPALREVLDDRELGGLARVLLVELGASDVPQPDEAMVFWLTIDTLAAQLATAGEPEGLQSLVQGLVDQHTGFFDKAWQVDHPSTAYVLEAMGRIHPDKGAAKEARKAAFKARSHTRD